MNLAVFITGGYDTVALTLSFCLYTMAFLVEEQKKLIAEVDECFPNDVTTF
jgi:cytochrome P450